MKKLFATGAVVVMALLAPFAVQAAQVNIQVGLVDTNQTSQAPVAQANGAIALAGGVVDNYSDVSASTVASNNLASVDAVVDQSAGLGNGQLIAVANDQVSQATVNQVGLAVAAVGGYVNNNSAVEASSSALNNTLSVGIDVTQD